MRKIKKQYDVPKRPWDKPRLEEERKQVDGYGLKNKKSLWRTETTLRKKRDIARQLLAMGLEERAKREKELLDSLERIGIKAASLDEVLSLKLENFLERRLQTIVLRKGLANTMKQARQFIVHGHIKVKGSKISSPSYVVKREDEPYIELQKEIAFEKKKEKKGIRPGKEAEGVEEAKSLEEEFLESAKGLEEEIEEKKEPREDKAPWAGTEKTSKVEEEKTEAEKQGEERK